MLHLQRELLTKHAVQLGSYILCTGQCSQYHRLIALKDDQQQSEKQPKWQTYTKYQREVL